MKQGLCKQYYLYKTLYTLYKQYLQNLIEVPKCFVSAEIGKYLKFCLESLIQSTVVSLNCFSGISSLSRTHAGCHSQLLAQKVDGVQAKITRNRGSSEHFPKHLAYLLQITTQAY